MNNLDIQRSQIPFLLGGNGNLTLQAATALNQPIAKGAGNVVNVKFGASGDQKFEFGRDRSLKIGVTAGTQFAIRPIFDSADPAVKALGQSAYLDNHPTDLLLYLDTGVNAGADLDATFRYGLLTGDVSLEAAADARYQYLAPAPQSKTAQENLLAFVAGIRLPANLTEPPRAGEVVAFEYGGRLKLGASVGLGYELTGSPSFEIGDLRLSERYRLAVLAGASFGATVAGRFAVEVHGSPETPDGDWARVIVRKVRSTRLNIAADVTVEASGQLQGLPETPNEFLAAALGTGARNWLNLMSAAREWSDFATLQGNLDRLAEQFVSDWIGKGFDALSHQAEFTAFLSRVQTVVNSYDTVGDRAVALFDGYFSKTAILTAKLNELIALTSWDHFRGQVDPDLWAVVNQLTDGDPLGWTLGKVPGIPDQVDSLKELRDRAQKTLNLIQDSAHTEIRNVIALAKQKFGLDGFLAEIRKVDTIAEMQALAQQRAGKLIDRVIGKSLDKLSNSEIGALMGQFHKVLVNVDAFESRLYKIFTDAANQSFKMSLHAEYNRSDDRTALVDVLINLASADGKALMREAGRGAFDRVLAVSDRSVVRINEGVLSHRMKRESRFNINIEGWHRNWAYSGFDRVIVDTEQRIVPSGNGGILVQSQLDVQKEKERKSNQGRIYTNFLVRFLGQSGGATTGDASFDARNREYMIDVLTGAAATYQILLEDQKTSAAELAYYLSFASEFGLADAGAKASLLEGALPRTASGDFGQVSADYTVRYNEASLRSLGAVRLDDAAVALIRKTMRQIVLANYTKGGRTALAGVGWAYWTAGVQKAWSESGPNFTNRSSLAFRPDPSPFAGVDAPATVTLQRIPGLAVLNTLFLIEESMVSGIRALYRILESNQPISPRQLESAVMDIAKALQNFDSFDLGDNTVFAIFDRLVRLVDPSAAARSTALTLTSELPGTTPPTKVTKVFTTGAEPAGLGDASASAAGG